MNSRNTRETPTIRKTRVIRSRSDGKARSNKKYKYIYEVKAEAPVDLVWAFAAITDWGYSYKPKCTADGRIIFSTKAPISDLREAWNTQKKDLHMMIETLNYIDDYNGDRYFTKYSDAKEDPEDYRAYYSDESDSEDDSDN